MNIFFGIILLLSYFFFGFYIFEIISSNFSNFKFVEIVPVSSELTDIVLFEGAHLIFPREIWVTEVNTRGSRPENK